jgi:UDP-2,3-diacylglucosamine hydrolase
MADWFSRLGPKHKYADLGMKNHAEEYQIMYAKACLAKTHYDYFIFGHRHIPITLQINESSTFINLGDWISYNTYAVFDGKKALLKKY